MSAADLKDAAEEAVAPASQASLEDFFAYSPAHQFIYRPTRELWPAASVNARVPKIGPLKPAAWLDRHQAVDQMLWAPGEPEIVAGKLMADGWLARDGARAYNLYRPPSVIGGNARKAARWREHIRKVYPDNAEHIERYLAHRVQYPGVKINHALVLGGGQGIGKDTMLEPLKHAVGPWNFIEISPTHLLAEFNGFVKSVVLRISEARDLGELDRYTFYNHIKVYTATPPDVLRCNEKNLREHSVLNVCGVIITTNHKTDGMYLPADDRRHYVAWSERVLGDFSKKYWSDLWGWYHAGGFGHVGAFLRKLDLSGFDCKAPPPKTAAWHDIVQANRAPEDSDMANAIEQLQTPNAITIKDVYHCGNDSFRAWLDDRRNGRQIPHRMEVAGYVRVRNPAADDGFWKLHGRRQAIYARQELSARDRIAAATALCRDSPAAKTLERLPPVGPG